MLQLYVMHMKCMLHKKRFYCWNILFPILLATLLFTVSRNFSSMEQFQAIPVGVVSVYHNDDYQAFVDTMKLNKSSTDHEMFRVTECSFQEAADLLEKNEIAGYVVINDDYKLYINQNGLTQSTIKSFLDQYQNFIALCQDTQKPGEEKQEISKYLQSYEMKSRDDILSMNDVTTDYSRMYYYVVIGMTCAMSIWYGLFLAKMQLANQSAIAARQRYTPVSSFRRLICGVLAAFTAALFDTILVMLYIKYVLKSDLVIESNLSWIVVSVGVLVGVLMGYFIQGITRISDTWKESIAMTLLIVYSFCAGIIRLDIKYYIAGKYPVLMFLNPVNLVADALYGMYCQESFKIYIVNLIALGIMALVLSIVTLVMAGRRSYGRI